MPKGPRGEKRPADVIGAAIMVAKIATGEVADSPSKDASSSDMATLGRTGGLKGGKARAATLSPERRREIAAAASKARWAKKDT